MFLVRRPTPVVSALLCLILGNLLNGDARANSFWDLIQRPGVHVIMRHALAPGTGDPDAFSLEDCSTQRNLDDRGRAQARSTGAAFRQNEIVFDRVLTSQWCRCRETAELLALGGYEDFPSLNSFFEDRSTAAGQTEDLKGYIGSLTGAERVFFVTHQVNITALTGRAVRSGEVFLISQSSDGTIEVLDSLIVQP